MRTRERNLPLETFNAECLKALDEVVESGQDLVVTKGGRPLVRIVAVRRLKPGALKGVVRIVGDVVGAVGMDWDSPR